MFLRKIKLKSFCLILIRYNLEVFHIINSIYGFFNINVLFVFIVWHGFSWSFWYRGRNSAILSKVQDIHIITKWELESLRIIRLKRGEDWTYRIKWCRVLVDILRENFSYKLERDGYREFDSSKRRCWIKWSHIKW